MFCEEGEFVENIVDSICDYLSDEAVRNAKHLCSVITTVVNLFKYICFLTP